MEHQSEKFSKYQLPLGVTNLSPNPPVNLYETAVHLSKSFFRVETGAHARKLGVGLEYSGPKAWSWPQTWKSWARIWA